MLGGGPIGCELGQVMARLGSRVTLLTDVERLLPRDDREASEALHDAFAEEDIEVLTRCRVKSFAQTPEGRIRAEVETPDGGRSVEAERLLVAAGRSPNVTDLGLEAAGVRYDPEAGIPVDAALRTNVRGVFALGDVAGPYRFTHTADHQARVVVRNALLPWPVPRAKARLPPRAVGHLCGSRNRPLRPARGGCARERDARFGPPVRERRTGPRHHRVLPTRFRQGRDRARQGPDPRGHRRRRPRRRSPARTDARRPPRHRAGRDLERDPRVPDLGAAAQRVADAYQRTRLTPRARALFSWLYRIRR